MDWVYSGYATCHKSTYGLFRSLLHAELVLKLQRALHIGVTFRLQVEDCLPWSVMAMSTG